MRVAKAQQHSVVESAAIASGLVANYLEGDSVKDLCKRLGISASKGYAMLLHHQEHAFKDAQVARGLAELEAAEADMADEKGDGLKLARAEKRVKAAQWKLERLYKKFFGQQQPATEMPTIVIEISGVRDGGNKRIEGAVVDQTPAPVLPAAT